MHVSSLPAGVLLGAIRGTPLDGLGRSTHLLFRDLVAGLVPIDRVPSALRDWERRQAARTLAHEEPWTEAILRVIESRRYRELPVHSSQFVADALELPLTSA